VIREIELSTQTTFALDLPARVISGRVVDPAGAPLENVKVFLTSEFEDHTTSIHFITGGDGAFEFPAVVPGMHSLTATAPGYLNSGETAVEIEESEREKQATIVLQPASAYAVDVVGADGKTVEDALIMCVTADEIRSMATSDAAGRAAISAPLTGPMVLYVFAPGSFAIVRTDRSRQPASRINLPRGSAALSLNTLTPDGKPLPSVSLLMRFDGELIPHAVIEEAERRKLFVDRTGTDGRLDWSATPRGSYEFWPYRTREEADEIARSVSMTDAPISIHAGAGENEVTVTFRERPRP
jgi:hypothetical protein